jgi:hypothetical protein
MSGFEVQILTFANLCRTPLMQTFGIGARPSRFLILRQAR